MIDAHHIAHQRLVKVGATVKEETIILSGIEVNEQVVTEGQFRLEEGSRVRIINADASAQTQHPVAP